MTDLLKIPRELKTKLLDILVEMAQIDGYLEFWLDPATDQMKFREKGKDLADSSVIYFKHHIFMLEHDDLIGPTKVDDKYFTYLITPKGLDAAIDYLNNKEEKPND